MKMEEMHNDIKNIKNDQSKRLDDAESQIQTLTTQTLSLTERVSALEAKAEPPSLSEMKQRLSDLENNIQSDSIQPLKQQINPKESLAQQIQTDKRRLNIYRVPDNTKLVLTDLILSDRYNEQTIQKLKTTRK